MRDLAEARDDLTRTTRFYEDLRKLVEVGPSLSPLGQLHVLTHRKTAECALDERRDKWCMFLDRFCLTNVLATLTRTRVF